MKAVRIREHGDEKVLVWEDIPLPEIKEDQMIDIEKLILKGKTKVNQKEGQFLQRDLIL